MSKDKVVKADGDKITISRHDACMEIVDQTLFGDGTGNCQAACIAMVLGLSLDDVPNFCADVPKGEDWQAAQNEWLSQYGLAVAAIRYDNSHLDVNALVDKTMCLLSGKSPRGNFYHCVVGRYRLRPDRHWVEMLHDPHPSRDGLASFESADFFVALNPAAVVDQARKAVRDD